MKNEHCVFEQKIVAANRSCHWSDELLAHVAGCRLCEEIALVASYLNESSNAESASATLPDAGRIWFKAHLTAKADALERALRPIVWARRFAFGACAALLVTAFVMMWSRISGFLTGFVHSWQAPSASPSAGQNSVLFAVMAAFLLILLPLIFTLYTSWSED